MPTWIEFFIFVALAAVQTTSAEARQAPFYSPFYFPQLRLPGFSGLRTGGASAFAPCSKPTRYNIVNKCDWNARKHPNDFPANAHFSPFCGTAHSSGVNLFELGGIATNGVKEVAETGMCNVLQAEVDQCRSIGKCSGMQRFDCSPFSGTCVHSGSVTVSSIFSRVSFLTMIAPSPDWFAGIESVDLCKNGAWIQKYEMDLYVEDAGTDGGTSFQSADAPLTVRQPISRFDVKSESNLFYNQMKRKLYPVCRVTLSRINDLG